MWNSIITLTVHKYLTYEQLIALSKELISLDRKALPICLKNEMEREIIANLPIPVWVAKSLNFIL